MKGIEIVVRPTYPDPECITNTDFLVEYKTIQDEFVCQPLTDKTKVDLIERWRYFTDRLVRSGLMDEQVSESLIHMFKEAMVVNAL